MNKKRSSAHFSGLQGLAIICAVILVVLAAVKIYSVLPSNKLSKMDYSKLSLPTDLSYLNKKCNTGDILDNPSVSCGYYYSAPSEQSRQNSYQMIKNNLQAQGYKVEDQPATIDHVSYDAALSGTTKYKVDDQQQAIIYNEMQAIKGALQLTITLSAPPAYSFQNYDNLANIAIADKVSQLVQSPAEKIIFIATERY